jgi:hypothetical protein
MVLRPEALIAELQDMLSAILWVDNVAAMKTVAAGDPSHVWATHRFCHLAHAWAWARWYTPLLICLPPRQSGASGTASQELVPANSVVRTHTPCCPVGALHYGGSPPRCFIESGRSKGLFRKQGRLQRTRPSVLCNMPYLVALHHLVCSNVASSRRWQRSNNEGLFTDTVLVNGTPPVFRSQITRISAAEQRRVVSCFY